MSTGLLFGASAAGASPSSNAGLAGSSWTLTYCWTGLPCGTDTWTFNANGTVTDAGYGGPVTWTKTGANIKVVYQDTSSYNCKATYKGTKTGSSMSGTIKTHASDCYPNGTWSAVKASAGPAARGASAAGVR